MNTYFNSTQEFYKICGNYIDKYVSRPETDKNHGTMIQLAGEYYEMYQEELQKNGNNEFLVKACGMFLEFQDLAMEHRTEELKTLHTEFGEFLEEERNKIAQQERIAGIFEIDIAQMKLQNEKVSKCQELVEFDIKLYGSVTEMTKNVLESQHLELADGQVKEQITEFLDRNKINAKINHPDKGNEGQSHETKQQNNKKQYQVAAYMKKTTDKPVVLYGNNPQELLAKLQKWNETRTGEAKYHSCYIRTLNPDTDKYENSAKYDVSTGQDVTPIYLTIPPMKREEFLNTIKQLKADGAKYNAAYKMFYITHQQDISKFKEYIPDGLNLPHSGREKNDMGIDSVMKKLEQNKGKLSETGQEKQHKERDREIG